MKVSQEKRGTRANVLKNSTDMFLYAHLAIEYLLQQPDKGELRAKIRGQMIPEKLEEMYIH